MLVFVRATRELVDDAAHRVALEVHLGRVVARLDQGAVRPIAVPLEAAVRVRHVRDPTRRVVREIARSTARLRDPRHSARRISHVGPSEPVEPGLDRHATTGVEIERVALTRLVLNCQELVLGVVVEADRRPRFVSLVQAVVARVCERDVTQLVLRSQQVLLAIVLEPPHDAVRLLDADEVPHRVVLAALDATARVHALHRSPESVVLETPLRAVRHRHARDAARLVVLEARRRAAGCRGAPHQSVFVLEAGPVSERVSSALHAAERVVLPTPLASVRVDGAHRRVLEAGVVLERGDRSVRRLHPHSVAPAVVGVARDVAELVDLGRPLQRVRVVLVLRRLTVRVDDLDHGADEVHPVRGGLSERVGDARHLALLVVGQLVVVDAAVAPRAHAVGVLADAVVAEVEGEPLAIGLARQQVARVLELPEIPGGVGDGDEVAVRVVGVARVLVVPLPARDRQLHAHEPSGVVVHEADLPLARVPDPAQAAALVVVELDAVAVAGLLRDQPRDGWIAPVHRRELVADTSRVPDLPPPLAETLKREPVDRIVQLVSRLHSVLGQVERVELNLAAVLGQMDDLAALFPDPLVQAVAPSVAERARALAEPGVVHALQAKRQRARQLEVHVVREHAPAGDVHGMAGQEADHPTEQVSKTSRPQIAEGVVELVTDPLRADERSQRCHGVERGRPTYEHRRALGDGHDDRARQPHGLRAAHRHVAEAREVRAHDVHGLRAGDDDGVVVRARRVVGLGRRNPSG